jgi:large subunit ribosomal protein L4
MSSASDDKTPADTEPTAEATVTDESAADEPVAEATVADGLVADEPVADEPKAKAPRTRAATAKAAAQEAPADEAPADEPVTEEPVADEPKAKAPRARKSATAKESAAKEPAAKEPAAKSGAKPRAGKAKAKAKADAGSGNPVALADLPADIFDAKVNIPLIHQVVVAQQAAARQGTHSTKTRGDVRGGGRKPYRQKGTGRARQGSIRAPQFAGGGVVHGPVPRSYVQKTPKKMKAAALRGALSDRARHGLVYVVDNLVDSDAPRTKDALAALAVATGVTPDTSAMLVVAQSSDKLTWKSLRNSAGVHLIDPGQLNTYDVLVSDRVVFTTSALASFVARAGRSGEGGAGGNGSEQQ